MSYKLCWLSVIAVRGREPLVEEQLVFPLSTFRGSVAGRSVRKMYPSQAFRISISVRDLNVSFCLVSRYKVVSVQVTAVASLFLMISLICTEGASVTAGAAKLFW